MIDKKASKMVDYFFLLSQNKRKVVLRMTKIDEIKQQDLKEKGESLIRALKEGKWEESEKTWLEILESGSTDMSPFLEGIQELWRRGQRERAQLLLEQSIDSYSANGHADLWLECMQLILKYNMPYKNFKNQFAEAFLKAYAKCTYLVNWVEKVKQENLSRVDFCKTLDKLVLFREGTIVKHRSGWGIGKVTGVGEEEMAIYMDLEHKKDHRMDAYAAAECLKTVSPDNFEAMVFFSAEKLKQEAENDPIQLIYRLLKFVDRPVGAKDLKKYLCPAVIDEKQWGKWWPKTRKKMITDSYIETSGGGQGKYILRDKPLDWEEEIQVEFDVIAKEEQAVFITEYLKNSSQKKRIAYFAEGLAKNTLLFLEEKPWHSLENYMVIEELVKEGCSLPDNLPEIEKIWSVEPHVTLCKMRISSLAQAMFNSFIKHTPNWDEHISQILQQGTDITRDTLLKYLKKTKTLEEKLDNIISSIMNNRLSYPDALLWLSKQVVNKRIPQKEKQVPSLVDIYDILVQTTTSLKFMGGWDIERAAKFFTLTLANKVGNAVEHDNAVDILNATDSASWLTNNFRETIRLTLKERFPKLFSDVEFIFTTEEGLKKYENEYRDLMENKIPANSKAIGEALSFGDLSENAELDAARELQLQLTNKANDMKNNMKRAQLIDFGSIPKNEVATGTVVTIKGEKTLNYTILGPWDVAVSRGFISYMSPIAEILIGNEVGENVELPSGKYTITAIKQYKS